MSFFKAMKHETKREAKEVALAIMGVLILVAMLLIFKGGPSPKDYLDSTRAMLGR